ncbi:Fe-S cluster assembly protein SufD [Actimicrobium sp. CCC2.4]|uniref:Fe-S cluster assembly protein SufD n=1 Tax=Actimicrobium sp. CCC2.4 TaxID=3048606 RepID=UPI002AC9EC59|nr:Fe-S cluster assembly protein SufD [Actimicrobium sp. CCC2.4]MEB0135734.1 Fe-S cluster assembly protein SufD [Actimicrobium sp. CCC2.4]WPX33709.1 Fe-S cluster assembly protein SufD [Actimicrobium sp. CCC2.4]
MNADAVLTRALSGTAQASIPSLTGALRARGAARFALLARPTTRDEEWRFTDLSPFAQTVFVPAPGSKTSPLTLDDIAGLTVDEAQTRLVFVDGIYAPALSIRQDDDQLVVADLQTAPARQAHTIETHLGRHAGIDTAYFAAQNTASIENAAVVIVPRDSAINVPVHLLFIGTQKDVLGFPRALIVAEPGSSVTVLEDYVVLNPPGGQEEAHLATYFTNAVTEIALADSARVNHIRLQREGNRALHVGLCAVSLARASQYTSVSVAFGARISRVNVEVVHHGEGASCTLDGLAMIDGRQLADTHTVVDHAKPHGISRQLHKCIAGGSAHAVFNGKVMVRPDAQKIDARQSNRNLLLSGKAHIDTKPQLEIFASDVKCTHGATVGQLDHDEVFYLQSRGLDEVAARNLLTYAFGAEIIDRIPIDSVKRQLAQKVLDQTKGAS